MKKTLSVLLTILVTLTFMAKGNNKYQPLPRDASGKVKFQGVVHVKDATARELYSRAKFWAAKAFVSANNVIELDDPQNGVLVMKGTEVEKSWWRGNPINWINFTLTVEVKPGRYRWTIDQIGINYATIGVAKGIHPIEQLLTKDGYGVFGKRKLVERFRRALVSISKDLKSAMNHSNLGTSGDF